MSYALLSDYIKENCHLFSSNGFEKWNINQRWHEMERCKKCRRDILERKQRYKHLGNVSAAHYEDALRTHVTPNKYEQLQITKALVFHGHSTESLQVPEDHKINRDTRACLRCSTYFTWQQLMNLSPESFFYDCWAFAPEGATVSRADGLMGARLQGTSETLKNIYWHQWKLPAKAQS